MTADLSPTPREDWLDYPPPTPARVAPVASLRAVLRRVFVEPLRDGFPTWRGTPAGFAAIMIATVHRLRRGAAAGVLGSTPIG